MSFEAKNNIPLNSPNFFIDFGSIKDRKHVIYLNFWVHTQIYPVIIFNYNV